MKTKIPIQKIPVISWQDEAERALSCFRLADTIPTCHNSFAHALDGKILTPKTSSWEHSVESFLCRD